MILPASLSYPIVDVYGRSFKTLRVSLTSSCNFSCTYCVEESGFTKSTHASARPDQLAHIVKLLHDVLQLDVIRLTGGEPTLYKGLVRFVEEIAGLGLPIKLTSNGFLLPKMAKELAVAGLKQINISLDAFEPVIFEKIARRGGLGQVLKGIDACQEEGIEVKLNTVIMKGVNSSQVLPLLDFAFQKGISIRYLELMRMGHLFSRQFDDYFFSKEEILKVVASKYSVRDVGRAASATAHYWETMEGHSFGIIANESEPFCNDCDRLRLDTEGKLFGCLSENSGVSILDALENEQLLQERLKMALGHKQAVKFKGSKLPMIKIGG